MDSFRSLGRVIGPSDLSSSYCAWAQGASDNQIARMKVKNSRLELFGRLSANTQNLQPKQIHTRTKSETLLYRQLPMFIVEPFVTFGHRSFRDMERS